MNRWGQYSVWNWHSLLGTLIILFIYWSIKILSCCLYKYEKCKAFYFPSWSWISGKIWFWIIWIVKFLCTNNFFCAPLMLLRTVLVTGVYAVPDVQEIWGNVNRCNSFLHLTIVWHLRLNVYYVLALCRLQ